MVGKWVSLVLRGLRRDWFYAGIKIFGLGVGAGAALVGALLVRDDLNYDRSFTRPDMLYRISSSATDAGVAPEYFAITPADTARWLNFEYSDALQAARLAPEQIEIRYGTTEAIELGYSTDRNIFDVLDLKFIAGDPRHALDQPNSVVMTSSKAKKIFGTSNAMGLQFESVQSINNQLITVTGILEDLPGNTHLDTEVLISGNTSFSNLYNLDLKQSSSTALNLDVGTYVRLKPNLTRENLDIALQSVIANHYPIDRLGGTRLDLSADPITEIHLDPHGLSGRHGSDVSTVFALGAVGALLLIVAIINYSNLVTAKASSRLVEIGVRKSVGATRRHIAGQLFLESGIFTLLGLILGLGLTELALPSLNAFLDRALRLDYLHDVSLDGCIAALFLLITFGGGAYPAWSLSALRPSIALKRGKGASISSPSLVSILVVMQFAIGIGMIVATVAIYQQGLFATNSALKFDKDQVLLVQTHAACADSFKQELLSRRGIVAVACSRGAPLGQEASTSDVDLSDGRKLTIERQPVDFGFFDLYHLPFVAGRDFSRDHLALDQVLGEEGATMSAPIVINETAARYFGFPSPAAALGQEIAVHSVSSEAGRSLVMGKSAIIGVVADFPVKSVRAPIRPTVFYVDPAAFRLLSVKLRRDDLAAGVASVDAVWHVMGPDRLINRFFLDDKIRDRYETLLQEQTVFLILSILGILVACIGLFGLAGYVAQTRTKEIGIRKALGATTRQLVRLLVWQFVKPVVIANLIAWPVAGWLLERWLDGFALRIDLNPLIFLGAGGLAVGVAVLVTAGHAIKVARARPVAALRYE
ncbi:MAG: putative transport system permease protein [Aliidongia sp.]|nr:putative transport system permease protein [Aliidongia sp.]